MRDAVSEMLKRHEEIRAISKVWENIEVFMVFYEQKLHLAESYKISKVGLVTGDTACGKNFLSFEDGFKTTPLNRYLDCPECVKILEEVGLKYQK